MGDTSVAVAFGALWAFGHGYGACFAVELGAFRTTLDGTARLVSGGNDAIEGVLGAVLTGRRDARIGGAEGDCGQKRQPTEIEAHVQVGNPMKTTDFGVA